MTAGPDLSSLISRWAQTVDGKGKVGKSLLQPSLAAALRDAGFTADEEDQGRMLRPGMPVWRNKATGLVEPTPSRRRIDIVVYWQSTLAALIETESDLNDLRTVGITRRNGHYDVASIAQDSQGRPFDSYKSIERMAAAAFYWHLARTDGQYPGVDQATSRLMSLRSDDDKDHNPDQIPLYLVTGSCRAMDREILEPRLRALGARLFCVNSTRPMHSATE